jgi:predicted phosphoribosyltransferase/dienelactone hydrolase
MLSDVDGIMRVSIPAGELTLEGDLTVPRGARGAVLFAHGGGSSRSSPRNLFVAQTLHAAGLATLLMDLLTGAEEAEDTRTGFLRFDIPLLASRLVGATDWTLRHPDTRGLRLGYFGASTGAAAALVAAADRPTAIAAVVSRGGRPDLALPVLSRVRAPTLLIVGGADVPVLEVNRTALEALRTERRLEIVPGATHLFEQPGALEQVAQLARAWFERHLLAPVVAGAVTTRTEPFRDRIEAGRVLARLLTHYAGADNVLVLGLPRGGVPVAFEVAQALGAPLDLFIVRKLGVPGQPELAMGAIGTGGVRVLNEELVKVIGVPAAAIDAVTEREARELERREQAYRDGRPAPDVDGRVVILVDDGLATGATMRAAIAALRRRHAARIVVAVPTAARETCEAMRRDADEVVCAMTPEPFHAVGLWYDDFSETSDDEVRELLRRAAAMGRRAA